MFLSLYEISCYERKKFMPQNVCFIWWRQKKKKNFVVSATMRHSPIHLSRIKSTSHIKVPHIWSWHVCVCVKQKQIRSGGVGEKNASASWIKTRDNGHKTFLVWTEKQEENMNPSLRGWMTSKLFHFLSLPIGSEKVFLLYPE